MHSLTEYTHAEIRAAVLSFICQHNIGTYVGEGHTLAINATAEGYDAAYCIGPHNWKFNFSKSEVKFSQGLINTPWKY